MTAEAGKAVRVPAAIMAAGRAAVTGAAAPGAGTVAAVATAAAAPAAVMAAAAEAAAVVTAAVEAVVAEAMAAVAAAATIAGRIDQAGRRRISTIEVNRITGTWSWLTTVVSVRNEPRSGRLREGVLSTIRPLTWSVSPG